jgi:hypothetical protein
LAEGGCSASTAYHLEHGVLPQLQALYRGRQASAISSRPGRCRRLALTTELHSSLMVEC